jgi:peptidoglycan/LPS O-acetylase OafA/YrhL
MFFCLSGYLITNLLLRDSDPRRFLIRRLLRIVPLAWLAMIILAVANRADAATVAANVLFYANLPPSRLMDGGAPLWSLCLEVQFYLTAAVIVTLFGRRGLFLLPLLAAGVTIHRVFAGITISITTWERVDEILAGATLALLLSRRENGRDPLLPRWLPLPLAGLLVASSHPALEPLAYARPYLAAAAIGTSLITAPRWFNALLRSRYARYIAEISYALYVIHGVLTATWLGGEEATTGEKYARRPLLIIATFALAHLSTRYFERHFTALGRSLTERPAPLHDQPRQPGKPQ